MKKLALILIITVAGVTALAASGSLIGALLRGDGDISPPASNEIVESPSPSAVPDTQPDGTRGGGAANTPGVPGGTPDVPVYSPEAPADAPPSAGPDFLDDDYEGSDGAPLWWIPDRTPAPCAVCGEVSERRFCDPCRAEIEQAARGQ